MTPLPSRRHALVSLLLMVVAFAGGTLVAELVGAESLGTAMAFGQIAFMGAVVYVLLRR
jgi:hypothetical protein